MKALLNDEQIDHITRETLSHYDKTALDFWESSKGHDIDQNYRVFLDAMPPAEKGPRILDLGCGPGRDLRYFKEQGYDAVGLDGCPTFCGMARTYADCEVWQRDFLDMRLPKASFDGVFANAALFHIPEQKLLPVLLQLHQCLKPYGLLFSSNPRKPEVVWYGTHPGTYLEFDEYKKILNEAGFQALHHYYRPPEKAREEQHWLAVLSRKMHSDVWLH